MRSGLPHRCRKCGRRRTFRGAAPRCRCGARDWRVDRHRAARVDHEAQTCRDGLCGYGWPHSIYSPHCHANPKPVECDGYPDPRLIAL